MSHSHDTLIVSRRQSEYLVLAASLVIENSTLFALFYQLRPQIFPRLPVNCYRSLFIPSKSKKKVVDKDNKNPVERENITPKTPQEAPKTRSTLAVERMFPFTALSHPTSDIKHPSVLLQSSNGDRYIFGKIPEGLQRTLTETKTRLSKTDGIFLTGELNWESIGGLPGLILTISDQGKKGLNLFYSSNYLNYVVSTWRSFVFRFGMKITSNILPHGQSFKNDIMEVKSIVLTKNNEPVPSEHFNHSTIQKLKEIVSRMFPLNVKNSFTEEENKDHEQMSDPKLTDPYIHVKLPVFKPAPTSTCYIITMNGIRGKFSVEKAAELGVPNGPARGKLASGNEITLDDGTVIKPSQVLSESRRFENVLLLDIPNSDYLGSAKSQNWGDQASIIYHFLGEDIEPFNEDYIEFIRSFGKDTTHYVSHPLYSPDSIIFKSSAEITLKLKALQPKHFNLPYSSRPERTKPNLPEDLNINILNQSQIITIESSISSERNTVVQDNSKVSLRFAEEWDSLYENGVIPLNFEPKYSKELIINESSVCQTQIDPSQSLKDQVETITLGTGSALPSKYRNVISTLVRIPCVDESSSSFKSILLDAGENTIGTMYRTFGKERIPYFFKELKMVYLSHLHADHHLGIVSIIKEWMKHNQDNDEKLYLVTPWQYNHFIEEWLRFDTCLDSLDRISYISCEEFLFGKKRNQVEQVPFESFTTKLVEPRGKKSPVRNSNRIAQFYKDLGISKFSTCRAIHCDWSYCCSITFQLSQKETFKVSYSGDTRPNYYMFAEHIGQKSDLLIHEATLENDLIEEAKKKRHSTINEAIQVANGMNVEKLILTHFSQRYPKLPSISRNLEVNSRYCFAFDSMINRFGDIGDQEALIKQLNKAFLEEEAKVKSEMDED